MQGGAELAVWQALAVIFFLEFHCEGLVRDVVVCPVGLNAGRAATYQRVVGCCGVPSRVKC